MCTQGCGEVFFVADLCLPVDVLNGGEEMCQDSG